jgi:hypothetical protein
VRTDAVKNLLFLWEYSNHQPIIGSLQMAGKVIAGYLTGDGVFTVHATQGGLHHRQDVVGD